jgi:NAD(P)-dependent dehydrogenase (short-subunit alcohol dehydrogenase family)
MPSEQELCRTGPEASRWHITCFKGQRNKEEEDFMSEKQSQQKQPPQHQDRRPGIESEMTPQPKAEDREYRGSGKLRGKVALITGGDSGIGRAVAAFYAKEGADVAIAYLNEHGDAEKTKRMVEKEGRRCLTIAGDVGDESFCRQVVQQTVEQLGRLDILVNNAAEQHPQDSIEQISAEQLERTFRTNIFAMFFLTKAALAHLKQGSAIINTASVTAYRGSPQLLDYSSTKGAIVAFTRSLSMSLAEKGIRVNAVAPGPIWTPLIPSTFPEEKVASFGADVPMKRAGQPEEVAPSYVFLASDDSSYMSGQVMHINGGEVVNG